LAENPLAGIALPGYQGLLELEYAGHRILYAIGSRLSKVYLLGFVEPNNPLPSPTSVEGKGLRKALNQLIQAGTLLVVRKILKEPLRQLWKWLQSLI
jgi:hypothetical protein